jgi:hypothetical protein
MDLEKRVIQSNQDVHVCGIYICGVGENMVET